MSLAKTTSASPAVAYVVPRLYADSMDRAAVRNRHTRAAPVGPTPSRHTPKAFPCGLVGLAAASAAAVALRKRTHAAMGAALRARGGAGDAAAAPAFDPASMPGATEPLGFWDPFGFCEDKSEATFMKYRGAELKHGRIAMLANAGFLLQPALKFPGLQVNDGALALDYTEDSAILGIAFITVGFLELKVLADLEVEPGNFQDPFKWSESSITDPSVLGYDELKSKNAELNNGRLAMLGAIGAITANFYTGLDTYEQWSQAKAAALSLIKTTLWWAA